MKTKLPDVPEGKASDYKGGMAEKEQARTVAENINEIRMSRTNFEKQWLINIAFLYGKQHFEVERAPNPSADHRILWELKALQRKSKTLRTSNYILPLFRSLLSRMLMMKSTVAVEPTTNTERDKSASRVSNEALEDFWQNCNKRNPILCQDQAGMLLVLKRLFTFMLGLGNGYLHPFFNPKTVSKYYLNGNVGEGAIGEVEVRAMHPFEVFLDPLRTYVIFQVILPVDIIRERYDKQIEPENVGYTETEQRLISLIEGSTPDKFKNAARVFTKYELPTKQFPNGRTLVCTKDMLLSGAKEPLGEEFKGRLPIFEFKYLDFMLSPFAQGMIEQLISLQEDYNFTLSRLAGYKKWMAGKLLVPRGAKMSARWNDETGQVIFYKTGHKPSWEQAPSPPSFLLEELIRIRRDMEDLASSHDASMGRVPKQVKSGVAIDSLVDLDTSQMAPELMTVEQKLAFFADTIIEIMTQRYSEQRFLDISGEHLGVEVNSFIGSALMGNRRVKVSLGSSLPQNKEARQKYILELEERGFVTKERAKELLEFGDIDGIYHSLDESAAKEENQILINNTHSVVVEQYEDHTVHLKVHTDFMKTPQFYKLPEEIRALFVQHMEAHREYLRAEQQAAAALSGDQRQ